MKLIKMVSCALAVIMLGQGLSVGAFEFSSADLVKGKILAQSKTERSGDCGKDLTWTLGVDGVLTIDGSGSMDSFEPDTMPWKDFCDDIIHVEMVKGAICIGKNAFYGCTELESVNIADSVVEIDQQAFYGCTSLNSIAVPEGVAFIAPRTFYGCTSLEIVELPEKLVYISPQAFQNCTSLAEIEIPVGVVTISEFAFSGCTSLESIVIPENVTSLGNNVFAGCTELSKVIFESGKTKIGPDAFASCSESVVIIAPAGSDVYDYTVENDLDYISPDNEDDTEDKPEDESVIASGACGENLTWTLYKDGRFVIEGIGGMPMSKRDWVPWTDYKDEIKIIDIREGVTSIGPDAFSHCSAAEEIYIPASIQVISTQTFDRCSFEGVYITDIEAWCNINNSSLGIAGGDATSIASPSNPMLCAKNVYLNEELLTELVVPSTVESIGDYAFLGCDSIEKVIISEGVKNIGEHAFQFCSNIKTVELPDTLETIGGASFAYCESLVEIDIPNSVTEIGYHAFDECVSLESIDLGKVEKIGIYAFEKCENLTEISIPETVTEIGGCAFSGCNSLEAVYITDLKKWCDIEFKPDTPRAAIVVIQTTPTGDASSNPLYCAKDLYLNNELVEDLIIPDGVERIPEIAFVNCTSIKTVVIPQSVNEIGGAAFYNCTNLERMTVYGRNTVYAEKYEIPRMESAPFLKDESDFLSEAADGFTLYGYTGSTTESYAKKYDIKFEELDTVKEDDNIDDGTRTVIATGKCGADLTWTLYSDGELDFVGSGEMYDYKNTWNSAPWAQYRDKIKKTTFDERMTRIGNFAFHYLSEVGTDNITSIDLKNINSIGTSAFAHCNGITEVYIPETVVKMDDYNPFIGCKALSKIIVDEDNEHFCSDEYGVLFNAEKTILMQFPINGNVKKYYVPESVKGFANSAFAYASNLESVTVTGKYVTFGNEYVFDYCDPDFILRGYKGSSLEQYARENNVKFEAIDGSAISEKCSHTFSEWTNVTAPGCNATGVLKRKCTLCGTEESQTTPALGHNFASTWTTDSEPTCTAKGSTSRHCLRCGVTTDIIYIEPKGHTFGAWVTDVVPTFTTEGSKSRICSACGIKETAKISKVEYDLEENPNFGAVNFRVVDFTTLAPVANINILCGDTCVVTDVNGKAYTVLPVGKHTVSVYGGDYNTRNLNITVDKGLNDLPDIGIGKKPIIEVEFNHKEMTIDEILDAGIDIKAEDNQHVFNYKVDFIFKPDVDYYNVNFYWSNGKLVDIKTEQLPDPPPGDDHGNGAYYPGAGPGFIPPPIIHRPGPDEPYYPPYVEFPGTEGRPYPVMVYPVNERFYLVVHGSVKWLKEMYDIQMVILNNSLTDTVEDCVATLSLPDGLSLATMMPGYEQTLEQRVPFIDKGKTATVNWYVRGDKKGSYYPSATLSGKLMPFEEEFKYEYTTPAPLIVEAGSAMHMTIEAPSVAYYGEDYPIRITLENVSDMPIYSLCHTITSVEQFKLTSYSDGTKTKEEYVEAGGGSIEHDIFNPGEKVVVEVTSEIMFESDMIKQRFSNVTEFLDGIDTMLNAFEAYEKAAQTVSDIADILSAAKAKLEDETDTTDAVAALGELYTRCAEINGKSVAIASALKGSEYYYIIKKWGEGDGNVPVGELSACTAFMNKIIADTDVSENSYTFDTVTSLIYATPVKFLLDDVIVTTLEGSTTEIPYTVKITENPDTPIFFGTQNVGMLSYSYMVSLLGDVDIPLILKLLDLPDSEQGYKDAVAYLKSAKGQIERFAAKSATGKTSFRAWVEDPDGNKIEPNLDLHNLTLSEDGKWQMSADADFTMSCSNPEATYDDGVLSFEGAGFIDVIPHTTEGATLCVEMTEDGITKTDRYVLESADIHECSSTKWETVVPAFDGEGYRARICAECEDIIEIEAFGANVFDDVPTESWYHGAVQYAVTNNIMNGTSETSFSPENSLTRAMFITVLYRLAGSPEGETHSFTDLEKDSWYEAAVAWASSNGIVNGVEPGVFAPNNEITREQMATIVYRFAKYKNYDMQGAKSVDYSDKDDISSYATEPVLWCSEKGIMKGNDDGTFMPGTHSTRAQAATVFMRLLTVFDK